MDPASIAVIVSVVSSTLGAIAQPIIQSIKSKKWASIDEIRNVLQRALAQAQQKGENKVDELTSRLLSLDLIQRTPALARVIDKAKKETREKLNTLRNDISELNLSTLEAEQQLGRAEDANLFKMDKETNKAQEEVDKSVQKLQEFEQKL